MVGIQALFQLIIICFNIFSKIAYSGLIISGLIGQFIVKYALICITFIYSILGTIFDVVKVLYEDYCIFLLDVKNKGLYIANAVGSVIEWFISTVCSWWEITKNICLGIYEFLLLTVDTVCIIMIKIIHCISSFPEMLKNFITLVGSGIWLALKLIPLGFVYAISMCVFFVGRSCEEVMSFAESIFRGILCLLYRIIQFLHDMPFEAQAGLILGTCIMYASMKYHTHIIHCFANLCVQMKYVLHSIWTSLEMLLLSICTSQNSEHENAEPSENEDSSDETESDNSQAHESLYSSALNLRSRRVPRAEQGKTNATRPHLLHQLEQEQESKLCVVCQDRRKCVIILPCRHLCLCIECCTVIRRELGTCPMCRQDVRRTMKVYV
jgi:hypothetical protein